MTAPDDDTLRAMLAAAPPGPWRTMQSYAGPWWVGRTGPCGCLRPDCDQGFTVVDDEHGAALAAAAPALAAEVLRLRAVIEHSADPQPLPTPAEVRAHRAAGGSWMVVSPSGGRTYRLDPSVPAPRVRRKIHELAQVLGYGVAYVALGSDGLPCASAEREVCDERARLDAVEHAARAHLAAADALSVARRTDAADVPAAEARALAARECLAGLVGYVAREGGR